MPDITIEDVTIKFPYEPYPVQIAYMAKVIQCLNKGQNGMLESPTGTGKTLCLLCATLAWVLKYRHENLHLENPKRKKLHSKQPNKPAAKDFKIPLVIYATRTHSQIQQGMQEMKKTDYSFMNAVAFASRDQLCINSTVQKESDSVGKNIACNSHVQNGCCVFYKHNLEAGSLNAGIVLPRVLDIEDLIKYGKRLLACPYYSTKNLAIDADVIFMPYNYLFDPKINNSIEIPLRDAIVIIDEAHNIDQVCEEAASVELRSSEIAAHIKNLTMVAVLPLTSSQRVNSLNSETRHHLLRFKTMLIDLNSAIAELEVKSKGPGMVFPGSFIFQLLKQANITKEHFSQISNEMEKTLSLLTAVLEIQDGNLKTDTHSQLERRENKKRGNIYVHNAARSLRIFYDNLITIFHQSRFNIETEVDRCFRVCVEIEKVKGGTAGSPTKVVHFWCFNPGYGMARVLELGIRSIILTSGTITPFGPLLAELNMPVSIFLANPHVIQKSHVYVKAIPNGPDNENLISNYHNRSKTAYLDSMGQTILKLCPTIPHGLLVFFPSYPLMNSCIEHWQNTKVWDEINRLKPISVEPRKKDTLVETMSAYYENIQDPNKTGACFMAVCRGKVSEGLDFADNNGRAVIITGLPFPPLKDMKVILKKDYLDKNRSFANQLPSSKQWYVWQAMRAVNQAIGRVIRHRNDYGAILLCDSRFTSDNHSQQLSEWVQNYIEVPKFESSFDDYIEELSNFFENVPRKHIKQEIISSEAEKICPTTASAANILKKEELTCPETGASSRIITSIIDPIENTNLFDEDSDDELLGELDYSGTSGTEYPLSGATSSYDEYFEDSGEADLTMIAHQIQEADRTNFLKKETDPDKVLPDEINFTLIEKNSSSTTETLYESSQHAYQPYDERENDALSSLPNARKIAQEPEISTKL